MSRHAVVLLVALAGCEAGGTNAFAPNTTAQAKSNAESPLLRIGSIRGPSNRAARALKGALSESLERRGFSVVRRTGVDVIELTGRMSALNEGKVTTYTWDWRMTDAQGRTARPIVGFERTAGGSSDVWDGVGGSIASRMAERIARKIALTLGKSG